jgi:hypothetical protein
VLETALIEHLGRPPELPGDLAGGRGGSRLVDLPGGAQVVLRRNQRGGLPARCVRDTYFGWRLRPFAEVEVTERLRARGVRVPEALGAIVRRVAPYAYQGGVATRYIPGSVNAWEYLRQCPSIADRRRACAAIGNAIEALHAGGARHADLNLTNFLIVPGDPVAVWIVDFDKARLAPVSAAHRARAWRRLRRSARRLDPGGSVIDPEWLQPAEDAPCTLPTSAPGASP